MSLFKDRSTQAVIHTIPTCYHRIPAPVSSMGCARLEFDQQRFIVEMFARFHLQLIQSIPRRQFVEPGLALEKAGWHSEVPHPQTPLQFEGSRQPKRLTKGSVQRQLADAEQLLSSTLEFNNPSAGEIQKSLRDEISKLTSRIDETVIEIADKAGQRNSLICFEAIRREIEQRLLQARKGSREISYPVQRLQAAIANLESLIHSACPRKRKRWRLAFWRTREALVTQRMTPAQQAEFHQQHSDLIDAAEYLRGMAIRRFEAQVFCGLTGDDSTTGTLEGIAQKLQSKARVFEQLTAAAEADQIGIASQRRPFHVIPLIESLDERLASGNDDTLARLYWRMGVSAAGCSVPHATELLWRPETALEIENRRYLPSEYHCVEFAVLNAALRQWTFNYLAGSGQQTAGGGTLSALERMRQINLSHPAFESRLKERLRIVVSRGAAYVAPMDGGVDTPRPVLDDHLFAHTSLRPKLLRLLANMNCRINKPLLDGQHGLGPFDLQTLNRVEIVRYAFQIAGGSLKSFQSGHHVNRLLETEGQKGARCLGGKGRRELRFLLKRPANREHDSEALFEGLLTARLIHPLDDSEKNGDDSHPSGNANGEGVNNHAPSESAFVLEQIDPTISHYFHGQKARLLWVRAEDILDNRKELFTIAKHLFENVRWGRLFKDLAGAEAADEVVRLFQGWGIVEKNARGLVRLAATKLSVDQARQLEHFGLAEVYQDELKGLTRADFINCLIKDDWLYSCCTFALTDAYAAKRIASQRMPAFARELARLF